MLISVRHLGHPDTHNRHEQRKHPPRTDIEAGSSIPRCFGTDRSALEPDTLDRATAIGFACAIRNEPAHSRTMRIDLDGFSTMLRRTAHRSASARHPETKGHDAHVVTGVRVDRNHGPGAGVTSKLPFQPNPFDHATACKGANEIFPKTA